jgi:hypothetical protein
MTETITGANDVSAFQGVNPAVDVHGLPAVFAGRLPIDIRVAKTANYLAFCVVHVVLIPLRITITTRLMVARVVAVLVPLRCLDHYWLFAEFHAVSFG